MFKVEIDTRNAEFDYQPVTELTRILHEVAESVYAGSAEGPCIDDNGNTCGRYWTEDSHEYPA